MADQSFKIEIDFQAKNAELFDRANKQAKETAQTAKSVKNAYSQYREELARLNPELVKQLDYEKQQAAALQKSKQAAQELTLRIRNIRAEAKEIRTSVALLKDAADDIDRFAKPLFNIGAAVTGGIFAFANKYVQDAKQATQTTREWKAAQEDLNRSGQRIGEVLATTALPILKEAAKVTRQIAGFLEAHPEAAKAALNGGLIALAVGTIGKAVSSGIRLVADLKLDAALKLQNQAANLQLIASENQLKAAGIQAESSAVPTKGGGGGLGGGLLLAGAAGLGAIGEFKIFQQGIALAVESGKRFEQALVNMGVISEDSAKEIDKARDAMFDFAKGLPLVGGLFSKVADDIQNKAKEIQGTAAPTFLGGSQENQDAAVKAFADWKTEDARIVQDAMETRKQIVADGERAIADITRNYVSQRTSIEQQYSQAAAQLTARYQADTLKAEQQYAKERADVLRGENDRIREIQQQEQEKKEQIEKDFAKAARSATADRDALALVQAQEARDDALSEADKSAKDAIAKEKEETQRRLQELAQRYAEERQQRLAQYQEDLKENGARRAQALKEAAEKYAAELKQQREANAQKLKDAADAANRERLQKREQFIAQLDDLGVTLTAERQLRQNSYTAMLADLQTWLAQMGGVITGSASGLGTASGGTAGGTSTPIHDYSGYAYTGTYKMANDGKPEYVLSGNDTKAAERAVGGKLTQSNIMQMIGLMGGMRGSLNYNPNISSEVSARTRRDIDQSFRRAIGQMLGDY